MTISKGSMVKVVYEITCGLKKNLTTLLSGKRFTKHHISEFNTTCLLKFEKNLTSLSSLAVVKILVGAFINL